MLVERAEGVTDPPHVMGRCGAEVRDAAEQLTQVQHGHPVRPSGRRGVKFLIDSEEPVRSGRACVAPQHGQVDLGPGVGDGRRSVPGLEKIVGDTLASINPNLTILKFQTFRQQTDDQFTQERLISRLTSLFGLLALLLAAIGLYGVTAYTVVRRTPEIGVRMALGAARSRVIGMVIRGAMLQTVAGLAIGIPVAIFCVRYVKSQLYEITSVNMPVMAIAIGVLTLAAAIAGIIPARRAASIDPVRALRIE